MRRRDFLARIGMGTGAIALSTTSLLAAATHSQPLGLQLFTVMKPLEQDFDAVLADVAAMGYREVETIGTFGRDPHRLRGALDRHGLASPSQHLMPMGLYRDFLRFTRREISEADILAAWRSTMAVERLRANVREAIGWAKVLGQKIVVLQELEPQQMATRALMQTFCSAVDAAAEECAAAGLSFNFHNHAAEFTERDGWVPYQLLLEHTNPKTVKLEMDIYWTTLAKADPLALLKDNPGRYQQCHVKDMDARGEFATVGQGVIDFKTILPAARAAGVQHFYVEYDRADDPMQVARDAYGYLQSII